MVLELSKLLAATDCEQLIWEISFYFKDKCFCFFCFRFYIQKKPTTMAIFKQTMEASIQGTFPQNILKTIASKKAFLLDELRLKLHQSRFEPTSNMIDFEKIFNGKFFVSI